MKKLTLTKRQKNSGKKSAGPSPALPRLDWVDEFIANVRPYIFVREEDNLLIRMPNQAHRLNPQGVKVLNFLLEGGRVAQLAERLGDAGMVEDVALFLYEIKRCLEGKLNESNRSRAVAVRPLGLGFSQLPVLAELAITARCNLSCAFCYYGCSCKAPAESKREMSVAEIERVLKLIYIEAKTPSVSFTGGEPTLHPQLSRLVRHAKEIGLRVNLITNGTRVTPGLAAELGEAGLDSAQVSLEGASAATHEAITGVAGSFARSRAGVASLRDLGIIVHTNTTLNRLNLEEAVRMPRFVKEELGLERFSMNLIIPSGSAGSRDDILLRYAEIRPVVEAVQDASREQGVEFMWYSPTPMCLFNPVVKGLGNKGCSACDGLLSIDVNGDLLPCSSWSEPVGNLLSDGFDRLWGSRRAQALRLKAEAHPACRSCDSFAVCHGACPLYWRRFGFAEIEGQLWGRALSGSTAGDSR